MVLRVFVYQFVFEPDEIVSAADGCWRSLLATEGIQPVAVAMLKPKAHADWSRAWTGRLKQDDNNIQ